MLTKGYGFDISPYDIATLRMLARDYELRLIMQFWWGELMFLSIDRLCGIGGTHVGKNPDKISG